MGISRRGALDYLTGLFGQHGYRANDRVNGDALWIELYDDSRAPGATRIGGVSITLLGALRTWEMTGADRRRILQLVPDELVIVPSLRERNAAQRRDDE